MLEVEWLVTWAEDLELIADPSAPADVRGAAIRRARHIREPAVREAALDALVFALNDPVAPWSEILGVIHHLDAWLLVGVKNGVLVRARSLPGEVQLDDDLGCHDADLGHVVDLNRAFELIPQLAEPPPWLRQLPRQR